MVRLPSYPFVYVDATAGASGDMFLGALLDLGYPLAHLRARLAALGVKGLSLGRSRVLRGGLTATRARVRTTHDAPHRGRREIRAILRGSRLDAAIRSRSLEVFERLIEVEAALHRLPPDRIHLHEVGALDALADVVGTVAALIEMDCREVVASPVNVGSGTVRAEHGVLPVPAPATLALLRGLPIVAEGAGEKTTPTGAALLATLASGFGPLPLVRVGAIGHGAGSREDADRPNILRLLGGERDASPGGAIRLIEIRTQLDDLDPRIYGHLVDRLLAARARDVTLTPVQMKKGRPGTLVTVLARPEDRDRLGNILFDETTTLGYRVTTVDRVERRRRQVRVRTPWGTVRLKVADDKPWLALATPEYEDCRRLAERAGVPLRAVLEAARRAAPQRRR